jgi:hypothetical protein
MIYPQRISDSRKAFAEFLKVTSLAHFLRPWEQFVLYLFFALWLLTWALLAGLLHRHLHLPSTYFPLTSGTFVPEEFSHWLTYLVYAALPAIPFLFLYTLASGTVIKKSLGNRGIIVSGWSWRGAEVEREVLNRFKEYLVKQSLYNLDALKQLIENVRDEATADSRPSLRRWTVLAITFSIVIAVWQVMFSQWLQIFVKSKADLPDFAIFAKVCLVVTIFLLANILLVVGWVPIGSRTRQEIYLHSLTAIRLELLKYANSLNPISSPAAQVPKPVFFSLYFELRHPFCETPIHFGLFC